MAIYYLHAGFVSRSSGRTSVQSAAYICGEKLHEDHRDREIDYSNRASGVALVKTLAPENSKYKDISIWNEIENFEDRYAKEHFKSEETCEKYKSSVQTAQTLVLALPNELSLETSEELLDKFIDSRFTSRGLISTYAIHNAEGNLHAHVQISRRAIGKDGEFVLRKDREICTRSSLLETRKLWADLANEYLAKEGFKDRITEKSYEDLGINLESGKHRGWYANSLGTDSVIAQKNLEISRRNEEKILGDPSIILDLLNEKQAVFTQKDILREIGKRVLDDSRISAVFEKALESSIYVGESINGEFLYTGERYQQLESDVLTKFEKLSSQEAMAERKEETVSSVLKKYDYLSEEQKAAVVGLTGAGNVGILLGRAGAGKTTATQAVSDIYKDSGSRVIGMSLSAVASENLGKDAGIESATIASWSHRWRLYDTAKEKFLSFNSIVTDGVLKQLDWYNDLQRNEQYQLKSGDVIIVDEAGMVGTKDWKEVLSAAEKFGAKVIAIGDDNQFKAISAGDCFKQFIDVSKDSKEKLFELVEIRRQKEDWQREASFELSKLNVGSALEKYEHHGRLHEFKDVREISKGIAARYLEIEGLGSSAVLCSTNRECAAINDEIRELKKDRGELGKTICSIQNTSNNRMSCEDSVSCKDFAVNDRIVFLENNKHLNVKNGEVGIVKSFSEGMLFVETESGVKSVDTKEYSKFDYGYAITLHKSQGKTYDNTIVLANKLMDAKAVYVGMTRHRDNVDVYYSKSDFGSFKELAGSLSKYTHKDSLEDYRSIENHNKSRVFEYKELLLETASVLREINRGETDWKEYHALKSNSVSLGREILSNYESHKLYLDQQGITRERLEISVGLKQRPLSNVELNAKNTVSLYVKSSLEAREMFGVMKKSSFNVTKHADYERYCEVRSARNDLAKEILSNYPLHREFVNATSREFFISKKTMESQVSYENKARSGTARLSDYEIKEHSRELQANTEVSMYAYWRDKAQNAYDAISREMGDVSGGDIVNHKGYAEYLKIAAERDIRGREIVENIDLYEKALLKYEALGVSKKQLEEQYSVGKTNDSIVSQKERQEMMSNLISDLANSLSADKHVSRDVSSGIDISEVSRVVDKSSRFLQNISEMQTPKQENEFDKLVDIPNPKEFIESEQKDPLYTLSLEMHKETEGYALYVSNSMLNNYLSSHGIEMQSKEHIYEYASMLVQKVVDDGVKEVTPEILESALKQAICFEALKHTSESKNLTPESVNILYSKAQILSEKLTDDNIRVLNDKALMKEANSVISVDSSVQPLPIERTDQIISSNDMDLVCNHDREMSQTRELDKSKEYELSR